MTHTARRNRAKGRLLPPPSHRRARTSTTTTQARTVTRDLRSTSRLRLDGVPMLPRACRTPATLRRPDTETAIAVCRTRGIRHPNPPTRGLQSRGRTFTFTTLGPWGHKAATPLLSSPAYPPQVPTPIYLRPEATRAVTTTPITTTHAPPPRAPPQRFNRRRPATSCPSIITTITTTMVGAVTTTTTTTTSRCTLRTTPPAPRTSGRRRARWGRTSTFTSRMLLS
mmetsp:Transcript_33330/g.81244  ORF Transcript_33330/g.81244 Transcript_33330/m.81244 type:complete len:225 (+) Transcript_33330:469-1143(+)